MEALMGSLGVIGVIVVAIIVGVIVMAIRMYRKVPQGKALLVNGWGGSKVSFSGRVVIPVLQRAELMDIAVKRIEIERMGRDGLVCNDNMRADIKVVFFVRVNKTEEAVKQVAESIGVDRASDQAAMVELFDAKFSEALKTVGKKFDFVDLYKERQRFKEEILETVDVLNGYVLDDCAIDYLEQTELKFLSETNILDAEGIKKITELTASQKILANQIERNKEKTIKQQDVEAQEAVLEMDRQLAETEERQRREISAIHSRETAEAAKIEQEERLKSETARLHTEEELAVAQENKERQIIVAKKNKERTEAIETERIAKDRMLEQVERERVVDLASIEKERAIEVERKSIQDVIRDRVVVEKSVVEEEEKIKDTRTIAEAERTRKAAIINAEKEAEELLVKEVKAAEARRQAAEMEAQHRIIEAEAAQKAADKNATARKVLAEAQAAEEAALGMAEVKVLEAKAQARELEGKAAASVKLQMAEAEAKEGELQASIALKKAEAQALGKEALAAAAAKEGEVKADVMRKELEARAQGTAKQGEADADVLQKKALAEAAGIEARAASLEKQGMMEATILERKALAEAHGEEARAEALDKMGTTQANNALKVFQADAQGIRDKAEAMKLFDGEGRAHEEFKLRLEQETKLALAELEKQKDIASAQAIVLSEGLRSAKIDIVGGESMFFDKLMGAITQAKKIDRTIGGSKVLSDVKDTFFNGDPTYFKKQLAQFVDQFGMSSEDVKNLTISALLTKMMHASNDDKTRGMLNTVIGLAEKFGLSDKSFRDVD